MHQPRVVVFEKENKEICVLHRELRCVLQKCFMKLKTCVEGRESAHGFDVLGGILCVSS